MKTIVVIDDSEVDRYLVKRAAAKGAPDAEFVEYHSAESALADFLDEERFATKFGESPVLVFLDINMPRMGGFEFLAEFEAVDESQRRCLVVMMFSSSNNPLERARAESFDIVKDYIVKPISAAQIRQIALRPEFAVGQSG